MDNLIIPTLYLEAYISLAFIMLAIMLGVLSQSTRVVYVAVLLLTGWFVTVTTGGQGRPIWVEAALSLVFLLAYLWFHLPTDEEYHTDSHAGQWVLWLIGSEAVVFVTFSLVWFGWLPPSVHSVLIELVFAGQILLTGWVGLRLWRGRG